MTEENKHEKCGAGCNHDHHYQPSSEPLKLDELDPGQRALASALRVSFKLLKLIMLVLVLAFFASGFYTIDQGWQGMVLRFGKIVGQGTERINNPGWNWCWPKPIDEVIRFPAKTQQALNLDKEFWYYGDENSRFDQKFLNPIRDGYCITRNDAIDGVSGNDYNILHSKWEVKYHIGDIELFFKNVYLEDLKPGEDFYDIKDKSLEPTLRMFASQAVVRTLVNYSIDQALTVSKTSIANDVKGFLAEKLDSIKCGIVIDSVLLSDMRWPRQVNDAFLASTKATQDSAKAVISAQKYSDNLHNETAGRYTQEIFASVTDNSISDEQKDAIWEKAAGIAKQRIIEAQTYRTEIVENARANAMYLEQLLPEYQKRPELVVRKIYQDALEEILVNADEKIIVQPQGKAKGREVRLLISRDPSKNKTDKKSN